MNLKLRLLAYIMLLSGVIGALILGLGGRLLMRGVAIMARGTGGFSWGGSLEVVTLGFLIGITAGTGYGLLLKYFQRSPILLGLAFGVFCYLIIILLPIDGKGAINGFPELRIHVIIAFGLLFLGYGVLTALAVKRILR